MNYLVNFFEYLKFTHNKVGDYYSHMEFEVNYEIITVAKNDNSYLFLFHKSSPLMRTNLCQEIILITEDNADIKMPLYHPLSLYLDNKKQQKQQNNHLNDIDILYFEKEFVENFEKKIEYYPHFKKIYAYCKLENRLPEKKIVIKKTKI